MADLSTTKIYGDLTVSNFIKGYRIANLDDVSVIYEDRSITAGNGLSGGGALSNNLTISMGTPTGLTAATTNALTAASHTHSIATATAVGLSNTSTSTTGTSASLARADHTHAITGFALTGHTHSSFDRATSVLSGASVFSDIVVSDGIVTSISTRTLTLANLGYTGDSDANNYVLPVASTSLGGVKSGTDISVDSSGNVSVVNDSHTHDTRYYTESESDGRFVNVTGDTMTGDLTINGSLYAINKSFRIDHPIKKGKKLTYGSLEGPENGIYVRGKSNERIIRLPDYWKRLIDKSSITVQITPIGKHQKLVVGEIGDTYVEILNKKLFSRKLNYYYFIQAERRDVPKLEVES